MFRIFPTFTSVVFLLLSYLLHAQTTAIPDANFEQALIDLGIDKDGVINNSVATADISGVEILNVSGKNIAVLTGIQDFVSLTELYCQNNLLESLSLSSNTKLTVLDCSQNKLTAFNPSPLTEIKILNCGNNQIDEIKLSENTALLELYCDHNLLSTLNLKDNLELTVLNISNNQFQVLNITFNWKLQYLDFSYNQFSYLDLQENVKLEYLDSGNNPITSIFLNNMTELKAISMIDNDLLTVVNFSHNHQLKEIICHDNDLLTTINLSATLALEYLDCRNNQLTQLQTIYNPLLKNLYCQNNELKALDLSQNQNLAFLKCQDNKLETLNLKNDNNNLMAGGFTMYNGLIQYVEGMNATNNTSLLCIQVDNETEAMEAIAPYDSWLKDPATGYAEDCEAFLGVAEETLMNSIRIYPNPAEGLLQIVSDNQSISQIEIYSSYGQKIKEVRADFDAIDLQNLSPGLYFIRISLEKGFILKPVLKK